MKKTFICLLQANHWRGNFLKIGCGSLGRCPRFHQEHLLSLGRLVWEQKLKNQFFHAFLHCRLISRPLCYGQEPSTIIRPCSSFACPINYSGLLINQFPMLPPPPPQINPTINQIAIINENAQTNRLNLVVRSFSSD